MNIKTIVEQYLNEHKYDGLYLATGKDPALYCQCALDNLMDCEEPDENCTAGYYIPCKDCSSGCIGAINED